MTTALFEKSDATRERTVRDIWHTIDAQFRDKIITFAETTYSGSQRRTTKSQKGK